MTDTRDPSDAYDDATLALEKAETLADLLMTIGGDRAQTVTDGRTLHRAFVHLNEALADARSALHGYRHAEARQ